MYCIQCGKENKEESVYCVECGETLCIDQQKHSGLGIASFIISIVSGVFIILLYLGSAIFEMSTTRGLSYSTATILGLCINLCWGGSFLALGLGIGGLFPKEQKRVFSILGTVFSSVTIVITFFLTLLSLSAIGALIS